MTKEEQDRLNWAEYGRDQLEEELDQLRKEQELNEKQTEALYTHLRKWAKLGYYWAELAYFDPRIPEEDESFNDWARRSINRARIPDDLSVNEVLDHVGKNDDSPLRKEYAERMKRWNKQEVA